jgi:peroxin-6
MVGLLPADVVGIVADAAAAAAAEQAGSDNAAAQQQAVAAPQPADAGGGSENSNSSSNGSSNGSSSVASLPVLSGKHLEAALSRVKARTATEIGAPQVPNVAWSDVGGLEDVKQAILDTIELPLKHR